MSHAFAPDNDTQALAVAEHGGVAGPGGAGAGGAGFGADWPGSQGKDDPPSGGGGGGTGAALAVVTPKPDKPAAEIATIAM